MKQYIQQQQLTNKNFTVKGIQVLIKDLPPKNISIKNVVNKMCKTIPSKLLTNVKFIKIGQFRELVDREIQAMYKDSTLYITNIQTDEDDMLDDMIHEVAHSVEEKYKELIYSDQAIEKEFVRKRRALWSKLKNRGFYYPLKDFLKINFDRKIDTFLHKKVGYDLLSVLSSDLFFSSYGSVSIREYFANGFEAFFLREDLPRLKKISPVLYNKIKNLL